MIVGTAGFSWSGSSAISDYLKEFDDFQIYNKVEFLLAYFPDGLEDLDFHLNKSCSKFLSSCTAIPRFRKVANYLLGIVTKGKIKRITNDYLNEIIQVKWRGWGQGQDLLHNLFIYRNLGIRINDRLMQYLPSKFCKKIKLYPIREMEFSIKPENFYEITQRYTDNIFKCLGLDLSKNIVLDQAFAGTDPAKSLPYYRNSKAILVDRDPRDLYVLAKKYFSKRSYPIPFENVEDFVNYYYHMHKDVLLNSSKKDVLYIRFEDLVYNYEKTTKRIKTFLEIEQESKNQKKYFDPLKSMINTQLFKKHSDLLDDIKYIENKLSDFLFPFEKYDYCPTGDRVFNVPNYSNE